MKRKITPSQLFIILSLAGIVTTILTLFLSHGNNWNYIFFYDDLDSGMDFFHSIEYVRGRAPYANYHTLYPPLANLFFFVLFQFVPNWQSKKWAPTYEETVYSRGTKADLRIWQPTFMLYLLYSIIIVMLLIFFIRFILKERKNNSLIAIFSFFNLGVLYAIERGNILLISILCIFFFVYYYNSDNKILAELALIALAIAAGLKIYPAIFGMMLLYDKKIFKAIRAAIYGLLSFLLPFLVFKEKFKGLSIFLDILTRHSAKTSFTRQGYSFDKILDSITQLICNVTKLKFPEQFLTSKATIFNIIVTLIIILMGFAFEKKWEKLLICFLALVLFQTQPIYLTAFIMIPLVYYFKQETEFKLNIVIPFLGMTGILILLPLSSNTDADPSPTSQCIRIQIFILILLLYICMEFIIYCINFLKKRKVSA